MPNYLIVPTRVRGIAEQFHSGIHRSAPADIKQKSPITLRKYKMLRN